MGPCLGQREHLLWHATFSNCWPLDDHPAAFEDCGGHVALRARPSRRLAVGAAAVAPTTQCCYLTGIEVVLTTFFMDSGSGMVNWYFRVPLSTLIF